MQYFRAVHSNVGFGIVYLFKEVCHFIAINHWLVQIRIHVVEVLYD